MKIDANNYEQWAMEYLEGSLDAETRAAFAAFLATDRVVAAQLRSLCDALPRITAHPQPILYPHRDRLLHSRTVRIERRQERFQRLGAMASGAAAAAVLFGTLLFFPTHRPASESAAERLAAEATESYPEGAEALARASLQEQASTPVAEKELASIAPLPSGKQSSEGSSGKLAEYKSTPAALHPALSTAATLDATTLANEPLVAEPLERPVLPEAIASQTQLQSPQTQPLSLHGIALSEHNTVSSPTTPPVKRIATTRRPQSDEEQGGGSILSMINDLSPISRFRTTEENGITIVSIIHISKKNSTQQ